jgi:hypothetical protein
MSRMVLWKRRGSAEGHDGQAASASGTSAASLRVPRPRNPGAPRADVAMSGGARSEEGHKCRSKGHSGARYLECRGKGTPTVMLEAGTGDLAQIWSLPPFGPGQAVLPAVSQFTRVCAYDRPAPRESPEGRCARAPRAGQLFGAVPRKGVQCVVEADQCVALLDLGWTGSLPPRLDRRSRL